MERAGQRHGERTPGGEKHRTHRPSILQQARIRAIRRGHQRECRAHPRIRLRRLGHLPARQSPRTPQGRAGEIRRPRPQLHEALRQRDEPDARTQRGRLFPVALLPAQMGRRLHRRQRMALHMERLPRPSGTHRPDGRQKGVHGHDGLRLLRAAAFRRQLLRLPDPRDTRDAGDGHGQLRPRQPASAAHDLPLRLGRRALEGAVLDS